MSGPNTVSSPRSGSQGSESKPSTHEDSWDWLEQSQGSEGLEWARRETELARQYLDSLPRTHELQARLQELLQTNSPPPSFALCERLFRLRRDVIHTQGILEASKLDAPDDWKTVVDVDDLGRKEGKTWEISAWTLGPISSTYFGGDSPRLLLQLSEGGSDEVSLREIDLDQGAAVQNGFQAGAGRITAAWLDIDHILISHALDDGPTSTTGWPLNTYLWTRGTPLREAILVYSGSPSDALTVCTAMGDGDTRRGLILRAITFAKPRYYVITIDGSSEEVALPHTLSIVPFPAATCRHLIACTTEASLIGNTEVPRGTLVAWDHIGGEKRSTIVYIPEDGEAVLDVTSGAVKASRSRVFFTTLKRTQQRRLVLEYHENEWRIIRNTHTPPGTTSKIVAADCYGDHAVLESSGLLSPTSHWLENGAGESIKTLCSQTAAFDHDNYTVETEVAQSKDGTEIDYFVLAPKQLRPHPTLMTGYGAFALCFDMTYLNHMLGGLSLVPWLESGGALVVPWVRGGGERGEEWHKAALQENRQLSYDDFAAVTEKLISDGLSSPQNIGIFGFSNGGLLAAVMGIQRPDLFSAVVGDVPLTDMLRFPRLGMGAAWITEYGDPEIPEQATALRSYSPYHNIGPSIKYPAFMITCSTLDDRVGVGHARKLVARLKEFGSPNAFLYEVGLGGHIVSDPLKNPALMARRVAFLIHHLPQQF